MRLDFKAGLTQPWQVAVYRAVVSALIVGAGAFVTAILAGADLRKALLTGLASALGVLAMRAGVEGQIDQRQAP